MFIDSCKRNTYYVELLVYSESWDIDHQTLLIHFLFELIYSISWSSAISMVPTSTNLIVDFFWGFFLGSEIQPKQELNVCPILKLDFQLQFVRQQFDEFFKLGKLKALIWQNFLKNIDTLYVANISNWFLKYGFCKKSLQQNATLNSWTVSSSQKGTCSNKS